MLVLFILQNTVEENMSQDKTLYVTFITVRFYSKNILHISLNVKRNYLRRFTAVGKQDNPLHTTSDANNLIKAILAITD